MPGPLAAQLAIALGYFQHGVLGATAVGLAFVVPSFLMVIAISLAYMCYGGLSSLRNISGRTAEMSPRRPTRLIPWRLTSRAVSPALAWRGLKIRQRPMPHSHRAPSRRG